MSRSGSRWLLCPSSSVQKSEVPDTKGVMCTPKKSQSKLDGTTGRVNGQALYTVDYELWSFGKRAGDVVDDKRSGTQNTLVLELVSRREGLGDNVRTVDKGQVPVLFTDTGTSFKSVWSVPKISFVNNLSKNSLSKLIPISNKWWHRWRHSGFLRFFRTDDDTGYTVYTKWRQRTLTVVKRAP